MAGEISKETKEKADAAMSDVKADAWANQNAVEVDKPAPPSGTPTESGGSPSRERSPD